MTKSLKDLTSEERALNNEKGDIAESIAIRHFEEKGWVVKEIQKLDWGDGRTISNLNIDELGKLYNYVKIMIDLQDARKYIQKIKYPDLVCEKGKEVMFIEVKSSVVKMSNMRQKITLEFLVSRGYKVLIVMIPLNIELVKEMQKEKKGTIQVEPKIMEFIPSNKSLVSFMKIKEGLE